MNIESLVVFTVLSMVMGALLRIIPRLMLSSDKDHWLLYVICFSFFVYKVCPQWGQWEEFFSRLWIIAAVLVGYYLYVVKIERRNFQKGQELDRRQ